MWRGAAVLSSPSRCGRRSLNCPDFSSRTYPVRGGFVVAADLSSDGIRGQRASPFAADATGTSPFQLCRSFRSSTGMTLTGYRHALRSSLERLRDGGTELTDVALDLGFSSHSHFTFAFRRQFGITPSDFRARA